MGVSNVSACMGGLANKMKSCSSSERVQAGVGHQGAGGAGVATNFERWEPAGLLTCNL